MKAEEQEKRNRSLRNSFIDGIFASGMIGFTQDYFTPFLLFIGGSVREVGLLTSLPNVIASLLQLKTADLMGLFRSRKRMITSFVLLQGLSMCAIALTVLAGIRSTTLFLGLVILFTSFGAIATPAWGSLMSDLVPEGMRGSYFGWRNSVLGLIIVASSACAGLVLQLTRKSDLAIVQHASRYLYKRYLRHGIRVYEYRRSVLHAKTAVIDGIWSTVGSSNIDRRSFSRNLEINAILLDQPFGDEMERVFFADLRKSEELLLQNWKKRSVWNFLLEWFFYRFRNLF